MVTKFALAHILQLISTSCILICRTFSIWVALVCDSVCLKWWIFYHNRSEQDLTKKIAIKAMLTLLPWLLCRDKSMELWNDACKRRWRSQRFISCSLEHKRILTKYTPMYHIFGKVMYPEPCTHTHVEEYCEPSNYELSQVP